MSKPRGVQLTKRDWQVINAALAAMEAMEVEADERGGVSDHDIEQARLKVHARLSRYRNAYDEPAEEADPPAPSKADSAWAERVMNDLHVRAAAEDDPGAFMRARLSETEISYSVYGNTRDLALIQALERLMLEPPK